MQILLVVHFTVKKKTTYSTKYSKGCTPLNFWSSFELEKSLWPSNSLNFSWSVYMSKLCETSLVHIEFQYCTPILCREATQSLCYSLEEALSLIKKIP